MAQDKLSVCCSSSVAAAAEFRLCVRGPQAEDVNRRNAANAQLDTASVCAESPLLRAGCSQFHCHGSAGVLSRGGGTQTAYFFRRPASGRTDDSPATMVMSSGGLLHARKRRKNAASASAAALLSSNGKSFGADPKRSSPRERWSPCKCQLGGTGLSVALPTLDEREGESGGDCGFNLLESSIRLGTCNGKGSVFDDGSSLLTMDGSEQSVTPQRDKHGDCDESQRYGKPVAEEGHCTELASLITSTIQVQTEEEQERLAGTAAHPSALEAMCACYAVGCIIEKTWRFASSALLALLHPSMVPVAIFSFAGQLAMFTVGPWTGSYLDSAPRVFAYNFLTVVQTVAQISTALLLVYAFQCGPSLAASPSVLIRQPWYILFIAMAAIDRLGGLATSVAFERDWVVQLAGSTRPLALANANSVLRRTELATEIAGTFLFGYALSTWDPILCLYVTVAAMVISIPLQIWLVFRTNKLSSRVLTRVRPANTSSSSSKNCMDQTGPELNGGFGNRIGSAFLSIEKGWRLFLRQPVFPASLAYVVLYFNVVLGPGSLMTAFLTQRGMEASSIGFFRAACAVAGFLATFASIPLIARFGVLKTGAVSLLIQTGSLGLAVFAYVASPFGHKGSLLLFLFCVVASRLGYWMYDVVDTQIFQTATPESQAGIVGTTELALCSLAELIMLGLAIVAEDVSNFGSLSILSTIAVAVSAAIYGNWIAKPTKEQVELFPEDFEDVKESREVKVSSADEPLGEVDDLDVESWRGRWESWDGDNNPGDSRCESILISVSPS